jgi:hypothetical protein
VRSRGSWLTSLTLAISAAVLAGCSSQPPPIAPVVAKWPNSVDTLVTPSAGDRRHYDVLFRPIISGASSVAVRTLEHGGGLPFDLVFATEPGGYSTSKIRAIRLALYRQVGAQSNSGDTFEGRNGMYGTPDGFAFVAHGVAVFVLFSSLTARQAGQVVAALRR